MKFILTLCLLLSSCSGYQFRNNNNPLASYGIGSLAIPQFINYSNIAGVGDKLTKEFVFLFSSFNSLKLYSGEDPKADAILVGIVDGPKRIKDTFNVTQSKFTSGDLQDSIGNRRQFIIPIAANYQLTVRLYIIKNPSIDELKLLKSSLGKFYKGPKVVVNESLAFSGSYNITAAETSSTDSAGIVNFTKNKAALNRSIEFTAKAFTENFKEVVLNAF